MLLYKRYNLVLSSTLPLPKQLSMASTKVWQCMDKVFQAIRKQYTFAQT